MAYTTTDAFDRNKDALETRPINFYDIFMGSQTVTDANTIHLVGYYKNTSFFNYPEGHPQVYTAIAISRGICNKEATTKVHSLSIQIDNVNKAMSAWAADKDFIGKRIVVRQGFRDLLDDASNVKIIWDGVIEQISFPPKKMIASVISKFGSLNYKTGRLYRIPCPWRFGGTHCGVNRSAVANKTSGVATGGTTTTIIDTVFLTQADDYWNYGYVEFLGGGPLQGVKRLVKDFDNGTNTLTLYYALPAAVTVGTKFSVYRGCDKTLNSCQSTYVNEGNYGGFHTIPLRQDY